MSSSRTTRRAWNSDDPDPSDGAAFRKPIAFLFSLAVLCTIVAGLALYSMQREPMRITWVGDLMLGDAAQPRLDANGYDWPLAGVAGMLDGAESVVANAEAPITPRSRPFDPHQRWHYNSKPAAAEAYAAAGIDVLGLANNHALDRGPAGLADTLEHAAEAGMLTVGAGRDLGAAQQPLLLESEVGTVGIVALGGDYGEDRNADEGQVGTIAISVASIRRGSQLARSSGADWVVGYVHWGRNYRDVTEEQKTLAIAFAAAGYDLVVGHHPHVVQRVEIVGGMPVAYSLGNFVFQTPGRFTEQFPGYGLVLTTEFEASGLTGLTVRCLVTDNEIVDFAPRPCSAKEAATVLGALHPDMVVQGETGHLSLPRR